MADEKEVARLLRIAQGHAAVALSKPEIQRVSFLAHCRLNWKRYAAGFTKSAAEQERFAEILDRATRDLMTIAEEDPRSRGSWQFAPESMSHESVGRESVFRESVEGAMDSVLVHEAAYAPPAAAAENTPEDAPGDAPGDSPEDAPENDPADGRSQDPTPALEPPLDPKVADPKVADPRVADPRVADPKAADPDTEEDRPRYGFAALEIAAERRHGLVKGDLPGRAEPLENAGDLQRKVQAVLRAHREAKAKN
ncbi:MAG TPA: hypothetical protein VGM59_00745, partial [Dongiaceae bacterium]